MLHSLVLLLGLLSCACAAPLPRYNTSREATRVVVGGGGINSIWNPDSTILEIFRGLPPGGVKLITAAGSNPVGDGAQLVNLMSNAGIEAEWIPIHDVNCNERAFDPVYVEMVERADAIFYGGGQSGRLQSCMYGRYSQSGIDVAEGEMSPFLAALMAKDLVGGSSAGAMNQPLAEILVTAHSVESYTAVSGGSVFQRNRGNMMLDSLELVDSHFSERGRQGRLMMIAMQTGRRFAFGVDEDIAYYARPGGAYEVVGTALRDGVRGGMVVYQDVTGTPEAQSGMMHFLTQGDTINPETGEITWAPDKTPCPAGPVPDASSSIFSSVNYRTISLAMSRAPAGNIPLSNFHGNPAVEVKFLRLGTTVAMCGESGEGFANCACGHPFRLY
jgi:cyanophycinase-like exopeptidase